MSKTQLKKELKDLDAEQLRQLLLDVYDARKEAREYLEFFVNPDIEKLYEKYRAALEKELYRGKYGRSTARISRIKRLIKDFASFGADLDSQLRIMDYVLSNSAVIERTRFAQTPFLNGMGTLACDILSFGDRHGAFDRALRIVSGVLESDQTTRRYRTFLTERIQQANPQIKIG